MDHSMSDRVDLRQASQSPKLRINQKFKYLVQSNFMICKMSFDVMLYSSCGFMLNLSSVNPNPLNKSFSQNLLILHIKKLVFQ